MTLLEYYKECVYDHGYYMAMRDNKYGTNHSEPSEDLYFKNEMDWCICADYIGSFDLTETDEKFLLLLGFIPQDFEEE